MGVPSGVGVVIPCFNDGEFLVEAVDSARGCKDLVQEIVVVDDGSTDAHTLDVIAGLRSAGITVIRQENQGLAAARNTGVETLSTEFYVPLDADNRLLARYLEMAAERFRRNEAAGVVYSDRLEFGDRSRVVSVGPFDRLRLIGGNYIDACAVVRRRVWEEAGGYDGEMPDQGHEDWDLWLTAAASGWQFEYIPEPLFEYRVRGGSMSTVMRETLPQTYSYVLGKHQQFVREACRDASRTIARQGRQAGLLQRLRKKIFR